MKGKFLAALVIAVAAGGTATTTNFAFVPEAHAFSFKKTIKKVGRTANKARKRVAVKRFFKDNARFYRDKVAKPVWRRTKCNYGIGCRGKIGKPISRRKVKDHRR